MVLSELSPVNYVIFTMLYAEKKGVGLRGEWGGGVGIDLFDWGFKEEGGLTEKAKFQIVQKPTIYIPYRARFELTEQIKKKKKSKK